MIISDRSAKSRPRMLGIILGTLAGLLLLLLWFALKPSESPYQELSEGAIYCGAENTRGGQLTEQGVNFGSSGLRSQEAARTGSYSCKLPASGQTEYGFQYTIEQPRPGTAYKASVWRQNNPANSGLLAVQLEGEAPQYLQENTPVESDGQGWERLEIRFFIPFGKSTSSCKIYVYSGGDVDVFFDDLLIEPLSSEQKNFQPEVLHLRIREEAMEQLRQKRAEALRAGILETDDGDWVNAKLEDGQGQEMDVEIRLKGDWLDHLRGDKWSFRVNMQDGHSWRRLQSFSLHTPLARYYLHEWLLHQLWEKEDVLTTRYDFVELRLNGQSLGIYAYEEHFDKQVVEYRQRREGPVLKFAEDGYWSAIKRQLGHHGFVSPNAEHAALDWQNADIEAFKAGKYEDENSPLARQYGQARILMQQYRSGQLSAAAVFDVQLLARYYAICDVLNGYHGIAWHNQRFYYNPITSKLEPIGFDGYGARPEAQYTFLGQGALNPESLASESIFAALFMDRQFAETYIEALFRLSSRQYLEPFLDRIYPSWSARLNFLQLEFPDYQPQLADVLAQAQYIHSMILPVGPHSLQAYSQEVRGPERLLRLQNRHNLPLEVVGYGIRKDNMAYQLDSALVLPAQLPRKYWLRLRRDSVIRDFGQLRFQEEAALKSQAAPRYYELKASAAAHHLFYRVLGTDSLFSAPILDWKAPEGQTDAQALLRRARLGTGPYRIEGRRIVFPEGEHLSRADIILPAGYAVYFEAGAQLNLENGAHFISFSPVQAFGTEEQPVRIFSGDGTGRGFTVMDSPEKSVLKHTIFQGLSNLRTGGWELTGAVTFYKSDVSFYRCVFRDNSSEDGLNTIRSEFEVRQCLFSHTASDGFDSDFCKGQIEDSRFIDTGNDGLDFSGSVANIRNCYFEGNGDKGISVGEESDVTVYDSEIRGANIAVASKDLSLLYVKNLVLKDCEQGFAAYQKKPEFGVSRIIVESYEAENVKRLHAVSDGSSLQLVDKVVQ